MASRVKFYGVRGSIPAPLTPAQLMDKVGTLVNEFCVVRSGEALVSGEIEAFLAKHAPLTYGGNTSCVLLECDGHLFVLDMGTGLRVLGNDLFPLMLKNKGLAVTFVCSHVHWDHIQGLPFFGPIFMNKATGIQNCWHFMGGVTWQGTAEHCLAGQMDSPTFPVSWQEIQVITAEMRFTALYDRMSATPVAGGPKITFGRLNHPQETYGARFELPNGKVVVYTTDNEPYDPTVPDPRLVRLVQGADIWITDCQYTQPQYNGVEGGVPRHGWGHAYPEAVAATALLAGVKMVVLFHHDPASSDKRIAEIRVHTENLIRNGGGSARVIAAWEGLEFPLD